MSNATLTVNSVLPAAERMVGSADMERFLSKLFLRCLTDHPGSHTGNFNCPESLDTLVKLLHNLRDVEVLQIELLRASIPLLNSHLEESPVSVPPCTRIVSKSPVSPRLADTQLEEKDCRSKFNHVDGRIILAGDDGNRFFFTLRAQRSIERKCRPDSKETFTCTHAFTSMADFMDYQLKNHWAYSSTVSSFAAAGQANQHKVTRLECVRTMEHGENRDPKSRKRTLCREPIIQHYYTNYGAVLIYTILTFDAHGAPVFPEGREVSSRHHHAPLPEHVGDVVRARRCN